MNASTRSPRTLAVALCAVLASAGFATAAVPQNNAEDALKNMRRASRGVPARAAAAPQSTEAPASRRPAMRTSSAGSSDFFDFDALELGVNVMMASYGGDYESDPHAGALVSLRAPMPWLSDLVGVQDNAIGGTVMVGFTQYEWDVTPEPEDADGPVLRLSAALDYHIELDPSFHLRPQIGVDWVQFMGIDDLDSGAGFLAGLQVAYAVSDKMQISVTPQVSIGEDSIFFISAGVAFGF